MIRISVSSSRVGELTIVSWPSLAIVYDVSKVDDVTLNLLLQLLLLRLKV